MKARWFKNYSRRRVDHLIDPLDHAFLGVIDESDNARKITAIGTQF